MVENLGRKFTLIFSLIAIAVIALSVGGFRLGLDLQGGTRLVYSFDLEKAAAEGKIQETELLDPLGLLNEVIEILRERLDPDGVREPIIRTEGENRVVIELPGSAAQVRQSVEVRVAGETTATATEMVLVESAALNELPRNGGILQIEDEVIRYGRLVGTRLMDVSRGYQDTKPAPHAADVAAGLVALDPWREKLENVGSMSIMLQATPRDMPAGTVLDTELDKAREWAKANPAAPISDYNLLLSSQPGTERIRMYPMRLTEQSLESTLEDRLQALVLDEDTRYRFEGNDVQSVYPSIDEVGRPAVGFQISASEGAATNFGAFTGSNIGRLMAIVINDEIVTMPSINSRLPGGGIITGGAGGFTNEEVNDLVTVLRSGSLRLEPKFEAQESVGATLGEEYVRRGFLSVGIGLALVLTFMLVYYRKLGVFAGLSLLVNLLLLTGALAFLQATLTLPGVAGIILTVGMAVDANILIYERIREEALKGRKPLQSAKDGFGNALSTIVDANLTTLITGLILYKFGTGPVRGFATTLSIGILTSMFSALVVTRVLVHLALERGLDGFSMARLVKDTKIPFLSKARVAITGSILLIIGGVSFYVSLPDEEKLGIDFLGGSTMTVRLAEAHTKDQVKGFIGDIAGIGDAEVKEIRNSKDGDGFLRFRITAKGSALTGGEGTASDQAKDDVLNQFRNAVEKALSAYLQKGPVDALNISEGSASGTLFFDKDHTESDITGALSEMGVTGATVTPVEATIPAFSFTGTVDASRTVSSLREQMIENFGDSKDALDRPMTLASPVDEVNSVGAQVVADLRDKAIFAILLSLFAAVMYIRVRFAEYSFGFAAVLALTHDVLITLGALALADRFIPGIETEINLPMIAAFLTIIGYSLNDTIVVFDRVRENLPRMKGSLKDIIDNSINQTLARTVLTSITTLITVLLLLGFNIGSGNVLEGFAFALTIGVIVGTYSSIFIASPALLYFETRRQKNLDEDDPTRRGALVEEAAGSA